jgi:hypothetical protein
MVISLGTTPPRDVELLADDVIYMINTMITPLPRSCRICGTVGTCRLLRSSVTVERWERRQWL